MTIYHNHHIVPRHMGGTDDPSNLVRLTVKEHAQAHLDLYNEHGNEKDLIAHRTLLGQIDKAEATKLVQKLPKTEEHKRKLSEAMTGRKRGSYSKEHRQKISEALTGRTIPESARKNMSIGQRKRAPFPKEHKQKLSEALKNRNTKAVIIEGKEYFSVTYAAKSLDVTKKTIYNRMQKDPEYCTYV